MYTLLARVAFRRWPTFFCGLIPPYRNQVICACQLPVWEILNLISSLLAIFNLSDEILLRVPFPQACRLFIQSDSYEYVFKPR